MDNFTAKMIIKIFLIFGYILNIFGYPQQQDVRVPQIIVSSPEDINNLSKGSRSIDNSFQNNIEDTIKEVEEIIKRNPSLPRLTRGEILDLLDNITKEENRRDPKAIMVVMPFTPSNNKSIEELYTKAPVTQLIDNEKYSTTIQYKSNSITKKKSSQYKTTIPTYNTDYKRRKPVSTTIYTTTTTITTTGSTSNSTTTSTSTSTTESPSTTEFISKRRRRPELVSPDVKPTTYKPFSRRPLRRKTTTTTTPTIDNQYIEEEFTTKAFEEFKKPFSNQGIQIIASPKLNGEDLGTAENLNHQIILQQNNPDVSTKKIQDTLPVIPEEFKDILKDINIQVPVKSQTKRTRKPTISTTTTTLNPPISNVDDVADNLSPEMRELLISFGLLSDDRKENEKNIENFDSYSDKPKVDTDSYVGFKPLPDDSSTRDDMDSFLASFGLGRSARKQKFNKKPLIKNNNDIFNLDIVPENLKSVLTDLGITEKELRKINTQTSEKTLDKQQHIFKPVFNQKQTTDEELKKLSKLLEMIKHLYKMNKTITDEDLKKVDMETLKDLVNSLNKDINTLETNQGPDPNLYDIGIAKNEIKRQTTSTSTTTTTTTTITPDIQKATLIKNLEDSFGGQTSSTTTTELPETTTTEKKTGFYYLVDWNSFLDIDDQKGKRVNLRFQPTIGDPRRFLSVNVP